MRSLVREVGNWVSGERFWNRQNEIRELIDLIEEGAHILLVAPQRVGKTSLMHEIGSRLREKYASIYVDLQKSQTPADAVLELSLATREHGGLWARTKEIFRNVLGGIESVQVDELTIKLRDGLTGDWQAKGDRILQELAASERPIVMFFDELPILVSRLLRGGDHQITAERSQQTDTFISWLRAQTIRHRGRIRFVLAGSIGLEPILRQARLSATINTFTSFELSPWDRATAIGCLQALANQYGLTYDRGACERIYDCLGCGIPHHVQLFFDHVYRDSRRRGDSRCSIRDVERVYQERILSTRGHAELSHYEERLKLMVGSALLPLALDLLTEAAVVGSLTEPAARVICDDHLQEQHDRNASLRELLEIFEHDGYLQRAGDVHTFISRLLADWWKARFSYGYRPASKRGST